MFFVSMGPVLSDLGHAVVQPWVFAKGVHFGQCEEVSKGTEFRSEPNSQSSKRLFGSHSNILVDCRQIAAARISSAVRPMVPVAIAVAVSSLSFSVFS